MKPKPNTIIQIIEEHALTAGLSDFALTRLGRLKACHDQQLGYHLLNCDSCGTDQLIANTCKGLHCPSCSYVKSEKWVEAKRQELVDCQYFHNVFTLPHEFNTIFRYNFRIMGNIFFKAVADTLKAFAQNTGEKTKPGFMLFLHTWDQKLDLHFHIHAVIAGGWLDSNKNWVDGTTGKGKRYLFNVRALQKVFRGKFIEFFNAAYDAGDIDWQDSFTRVDLLRLLPKEWVVYSKSADGSVDKVIRYLGRYTHRTGLAKSRLEYAEGKVQLACKDRKTGQPRPVMMTGVEFLQKFTQHFFQDSIQRVRYYGFLGNAAKKKDLKIVGKQVGKVLTDSVIRLPECSNCGASEFTFVRIKWQAAPLLKERKRQSHGPPSLPSEIAA